MADNKKVRDAFGRWARTQRGGVELDVAEPAQHSLSQWIRDGFKRGDTEAPTAEGLKAELAAARNELADLRRKAE